MTNSFSLEKEHLRHKKYLIYLQILAALCIGILASEYFKLLKIEATFFILTLNNASIAFIVGFVGFVYLRNQIGIIEEQIGKNVRV